MKKRSIACSDTPVRVTGLVADLICFGLDNATARDAVRKIAHQLLADEKPSELNGLGRQSQPGSTGAEA